jgi:hypothetical protein
LRATLAAKTACAATNRQTRGWINLRRTTATPLRATLAAKSAWLLLPTAARRLLLSTPLRPTLAAEHTAHVSHFILVHKSIFVLIHPVK